MSAIDELFEECGNFDQNMSDLRDKAAIELEQLVSSLAQYKLTCQSYYDCDVQDRATITDLRAALAGKDAELAEARKVNANLKLALEKSSPWNETQAHSARFRCMHCNHEYDWNSDDIKQSHAVNCIWLNAFLELHATHPEPK
jgi:hypothetical protein